MRKVRSTTSFIWNYFDVCGDAADKKATCKYCKNILSYKSTISNLKLHLKKVHNDVFEEYCPMELASRNRDEDSNDSGHQSSDIWNFFEQETGGRVRCVVCCASCSNNTDDLKNHLAEKHPRLLNGTIQDTTASDESGNEDDGTYTEVIYLEEDAKKKTPKYIRKEIKTRSEPKKIKRIGRERRVSVSSDDIPIKRRKQETTNELDTFLTYIRCLLSQVPSEMCTKLQLDIVNLIMKAKLSRGSVNDSVVLDSAMQVAREVNVDRADVISVALADADIAPITESDGQCYEDVKDNH